MEQHPVSLALSEDEQAFVEAEIAEGRYGSERDVLRAGLASLERERKLSALYSLADIESEALREPAHLTRHISQHADALSAALEVAEASGTSGRQIPEIMQQVKAKLRVDGSL